MYKHIEVSQRALWKPDFPVGRPVIGRLFKGKLQAKKYWLGGCHSNSLPRGVWCSLVHWFFFTAACTHTHTHMDFSRMHFSTLMIYQWHFVFIIFVVTLLDIMTICEARGVRNRIIKACFVYRTLISKLINLSCNWAQSTQIWFDCWKRSHAHVKVSMVNLIQLFLLYKLPVCCHIPVTTPNQTWCRDTELK